MELKCGRVGMSPLIEKLNGGLREMMEVNLLDRFADFTQRDCGAEFYKQTNDNLPSMFSNLKFSAFFLSHFVPNHDAQQRSSRWNLMQNFPVSA